MIPLKLGDFLNSINYSKENLFIGDPELASKRYPAFVVNRCLSYFPDTIFFANEMNIHHHLDNRVQYEYLLTSIRKRKRFSKWAKDEKSKDLDLIKKCYGYNNRKAEEALSVLTKEQIDEIRDYMSEGGTKNHKS